MYNVRDYSGELYFFLLERLVTVNVNAYFPNCEFGIKQKTVQEPCSVTEKGQMFYNTEEFVD